MVELCCEQSCWLPRLPCRQSHHHCRRDHRDEASTHTPHGRDGQTDWTGPAAAAQTHAVTGSVMLTSLVTCRGSVTMTSPAPHSGRVSTCGSRPERSLLTRSLFTQTVKYYKHALCCHDYPQEKYVCVVYSTFVRDIFVEQLKLTKKKKNPNLRKWKNYLTFY